MLTYVFRGIAINHGGESHGNQCQAYCQEQ